MFTVQNDSARPAHLFVARVGQPVGAVVGTPKPDTVPPATTMDVTLGLPPDGEWAIFLNPDPEGGPMLTAADVPAGFSGRQ